MLKKLLFLVLVFMLASILYLTLSRIPSPLFAFTNALIISFCGFGLTFYDQEYFSLHKITLSFILFFFGIIPLVEYSSGVTYWGGETLSLSSMIYANVLIISFIFSYLLSYEFAHRSKFRVDRAISIDQERWKFVRRAGRLGPRIILLISVFAAFAALWYNNYDLVGVLFRGGGESGRVSLSGPGWLIYNYFVKVLPATAFLYILMSYKYERSNSSKIILYLSFILLVLFVSPMSSARFLIAAIYIAVLVSATNILNGAYRLPLLLVASLLTVFPALDSFRLFSANLYGVGYDLDFLVGGHFDAYQNLVRIVQLDHYTMGRQLLGAVLFFVPRSLWPDKPIGSGAYMADLAQLEWSNISFPFVAEGYINFSFVGVFLFAMCLGTITGRIDKIFWALRARNYQHTYFSSYFLLIGMLFFMMRGDLMSSFAYTIGIVGSSFFLLYLVILLGRMRSHP